MQATLSFSFSSVTGNQSALMLGGQKSYILVSFESQEGLFFLPKLLAMRSNLYEAFSSDSDI